MQASLNDAEAIQSIKVESVERGTIFTGVEMFLRSRSIVGSRVLMIKRAWLQNGSAGREKRTQLLWVARPGCNATHWNALVFAND